MKYDVVLLTRGKYVDPKEIDWYTEQVLTEDGLVKAALENKGLKVAKKDWSDPEFDWSQTKLAVFRTTWDYFHRFPEFSAWLSKTKSQTRFINSAEQIEWNVDKKYLAELQEKGIHIVESKFIEKGTKLTLKELHELTGWTETVIKPNVSGGGRHTYRLNLQALEEHEGIFRQVISEEPMLLQPFQHQIMDRGEVSHMVIGGKYTHSVLKLAKKGDYRVQDDWGGTVHDYIANEEEIALAEDAVKACFPLPAYARVDLVWDNDDKLALSELELIEPEMWFRKNPDAAELLADEICKYL